MLTVLNENGGWCWYQDDRVIVDRKTGRVLAATVANHMGVDGERRDADIDVTTFDPAAGAASTTTLSNIPTVDHGDDHNVAGLWQRPDGRYLAVYTGHNYGNGSHGRPRGVDTRPDSFYRISTHPHDASEWQPEQHFTWPSNDPVGDGRNFVTYSNLHHLSEEGGDKGRLYNIGRAAGNVWQIATSDDWGETWAYRGILTLPPTGGRAYSNGYMKFTNNGKDRIDFITTEAHPRDYNNGIYHGYIQAGKTYDAAGHVIDGDLFSETAPAPEAFTTIFAPAEVADDTHHHAWTIEVGWGADGALYALFSTRFGTELSPKHKQRERPGNADHRLFHARFDGAAWHTTELAKMGPGLWDSEEDYTGLGVIDPVDGRTVYVSTPIDPRSGAALPHHELFEGQASADRSQWTWTPITEASQVDHLRPQLALLDQDNALLLWLRGTYDSQHRYAQAVVCRPVRRRVLEQTASAADTSR